MGTGPPWSPSQQGCAELDQGGEAVLGEGPGSGCLGRMEQGPQEESGRNHTAVEARECRGGSEREVSWCVCLFESIPVI